MKKNTFRKKLKDFAYDYNDLFVATVILLIAGSIIFWRMGHISAYPKYLAALQAEKMQEEDPFLGIDLTPDQVDDINENPDEITSDPNDPSGGEAGEEEPDDPEPVDPAAPFKTKGDVSFTVPVGVAGSKIARLLYEQGLVESADAFLDAVAVKNAETRLKAGTFHIPAGSTVEDIVAILTR